MIRTELPAFVGFTQPDHLRWEELLTDLPMNTFDQTDYMPEEAREGGSVPLGVLNVCANKAKQCKLGGQNTLAGGWGK